MEDEKMETFKLMSFGINIGLRNLKQFAEKIFLYGSIFILLLTFTIPTHAATIEPQWNGDGLNPFIDFVNSGEENISIYGLSPTILSMVKSLQGRGRLDLNLKRSFSITIDKTNPFAISEHWYWAMLYLDFVNYKLYFPDGDSYQLINPQLRKTATPPKYTRYDDFGSEVFCEKVDTVSHAITTIILKNGTKIETPNNRAYQTVTDIHGNQIKYIFTVVNGVRRMTSLIDSAGHQFNFTYSNDSFTSLTEIKQMASPAPLVIFKRSRTGKQESFTDALNRVTKYTYNTYGGYERITEILYPNNVKSTYTYSYQYNSIDNNYLYVISNQKYYRPGENTPFRNISYTVNQNNIYDITMNDGTKIVNYELTQTKVKGYTLRKSVKNLSGVLVQLMQKNYIYTKNTFNKDIARPQSIITQFTKSDGSLASPIENDFQYDDWGNITMTKDPNNTITYMAYANTNNYGSNINLSQINPAYQNAKYQSDSSNQYNLLLTKATLINDPVHNTTQLNQTHYQFDSQGNLLKESIVYNGSTLDTTYTYDQYGNVLSKIDPLGNTILYTYNTGLTGINDSSYLIKISSKDAAIGTITVLATYSDFNDLGKPTTETDPNNNTLKYSYDAIGRIIKQSVVNADPNVAVSKIFAYDDLNNTVSIFYGNTIKGWQASRNINNPLFGKLDKLLQLPSLLTVTSDNSSDLLAALGSNPSWHTIKTNTYDCDGRVISEIDGMNNTTSYDYDPLNRIVKITYPDGNYSTTNWDGFIVTKYDANGNKRQENYDLLNRLIQLTEYPDSNTSYSTTYTYDSASHLIQTQNPKGALTTSTFNNLGQLIRIDFPQDGASPLTAEVYTYDNAGNLLTKTQGQNSKAIIYEFLGDYRIKQVTTQPDV
jgi:YD repeat-containing protein